MSESPLSLRFCLLRRDLHVRAGGLPWHSMQPANGFFTRPQRPSWPGALAEQFNDAAETAFTRAQAIGVLLNEPSELPSWGNAHDVITISRENIRTAIDDSLSPPNKGQGHRLPYPFQMALLACMLATPKRLRDRGNLPQNPPLLVRSLLPLSIEPPQMAVHSIKTTVATKQTIDTASGERSLSEPVREGRESVVRDPNVTDAVWMQFQADRFSAIGARERRRDAGRQTEGQVRERNGDLSCRIPLD